MAGYSGKSLVDKLGYKPGDSVYLSSAPDWYKQHLQKSGLEIIDHLPGVWAHGFFQSQNEIANFLQSINLSGVDKGLWVSWPKKASGIKTDISEQTFRDMILPLAWVDVKVAAIDDTWSGLLFYRRKN